MSEKELLRALIVEHDMGDVLLVVLELRRAGFDVDYDVVATFREFVMQLRTRTYDVVLADYRLPAWNGMEALSTLQERGLKIPFILVTGTLGDERAAECMKQGASDFIIKNNLSRLPMAVRRAMTEHRANGERERAHSLIRILSMAVEQSPASIIITDATGLIIFVNPRFTEATGYAPDEVMGRSPKILKSGETSAETYASLWQTVTSGRIWSGELRNRRKNGEPYWDSVRISPVRNAHGIITNYVAIQEDVTERRRAEVVIREREERFSQLANNIDDVFYVMDSAFKETLYISPAYETVWGKSCKSLYDDPWSFAEPILPEDLPLVIANTAKAQAGEVPEHIEFRIRRPDGEVRWILAHTAPVRNAQGEVYRVSGVSTDITERRMVAEALRESEERFRQLAENSKELFFVADVTTGFALYLSPAYEEIWGRSCESGRATPRAWLDGIHPDDRERVANLDRNVVGDEAHWEVYRVVRPDSSIRWVRSRATIAYNAQGEEPRMVGVAEDFTELHQAEDLFRQAQKMEAVGRLAGGVAHDFNNLLTVISAYSSMLGDSFDETDPRLQDLGEIQRAAAAAAGLTRQLLAFSRQQVIEPQLVTVEGVVEAATKMLQRLIGEDVELLTLMADDRSNVWIDPGQLEQIIMNLAVNSRDAMPDGGTLTIETTRTDLDEAYARSHGVTGTGPYVMLAVSDTGVGMTAETRSRIFEPFFTTKPVGQGTGLGLATVYGIVKQCQGFVWVYSEVGIGTTFKIYLPLAGEEVEATTRSAPSANPRGSETILLVEDSAAVRVAAHQILERLGYSVIEAPTGVAAMRLAAAREETIHLLLTDVVMPEMNGRELADEFTRLRPDAKVLFMSGYTNDAIVRHGVLLPGISYLQKPFTPAALAKKVREVIDSRASP